ncbi:divergent polysaccharide deacetylase family protein [Iodidimonas gelatinilytica]|uniref:divergent polysaccharide deacetylase family protein n=1 Tax=Iodidimonas gelatinilytica TaxID=1236966 RepID=UPI001230B170|nr:divergent polysaccharide deacetylase family protein [Iodidimonas gelatinilytica]
MKAKRNNKGKAKTPSRQAGFGRRTSRPSGSRAKPARRAWWPHLAQRLRAISQHGQSFAGRLAQWTGVFGALLVLGLILVALSQLTGVHPSRETEMGMEREMRPAPSLITPPQMVFDDSPQGDSRIANRSNTSPHITPLDPPSTRPAWMRFAAAPPKDADSKPAIVLVIDDVGLNRSATKKLIKLDGALTLSFLPYADHLPEQTAAARKAGHELMVHLPMEPQGNSADPGPMALLGTLNEQEFQSRLQWNLERFTGFVGVNNHMGSRLTENPKAMEMVMQSLQGRGLLFLDSRTTAHTVAQRKAAEMGVPNIARDVFLDNEQTAESVIQNLDDMERLARRTGLAIGIGHPHPQTIKAIAHWLPDAKKRGLVLLPLSAAVTRMENRQKRFAATPNHGTGMATP